MLSPMHHGASSDGPEFVPEVVPGGAPYDVPGGVSHDVTEDEPEIMPEPSPCDMPFGAPPDAPGGAPEPVPEFPPRRLNQARPKTPFPLSGGAGSPSSASSSGERWSAIRGADRSKAGPATLTQTTSSPFAPTCRSLA